MSLKKILEDISQVEDIEQDYWYLSVAVIMASVNKPEDIKHVYNRISSQVDDMQLSKTEKNKLLAKITIRLREAALKSYIIVGFPKVINALSQLANATPDAIKSLLPDKPLRKEETWADIQDERKRGQVLFDRIYDRFSQKVYKNMFSTHPDLAQTALFHLYGPALSEDSILSAKETSFVTVTGLMIQNIPLQLASHRHGALHNGASKGELNRLATIVSVLADYYKTPIAKL